MISVNFNGVDVFLFNEYPNFKKGMESTHELFTDVQTSLTLRESRRPWSSKLRTSIKSTHVVVKSELLVLQASLRQLKAQPVLCPFWPAVSFWSSRAAAKIKGGLLVAFKQDWSQYEVYEAGSEPGWPLAGDCVVPVLYGFLTSHVPKWKNAEQSVYEFEFVEAGKQDYALTFTASAFPSGPQPAGYAAAPKIVPMRNNFKDVNDDFSFEVNRIDLVLSREQGASFYPHDVYRTQRASYTLSSNALAASFLSFYETLAGVGASFWASSGFEAGKVGAALVAGATALTLVDASSLLAGDYICAYSSVDSAHFAKIQSIAGNVVTLVAGFDINLEAGSQLFTLCLARFGSQKISINWATPSLSVVSFDWSEVLPEATIPGDETLGTTLGALKLRAVLFHFWRDYLNGSTEDWYFTSYENDITYSGHTYLGGIFQCQQISLGLNLENDSCDIDASLVDAIGNLIAGHPFLGEVMALSEVPLNVEVYFADITP
jgi:hypothetical protein